MSELEFIKPQLMSHSRWSGYLRCPNQLRLRKGGYPTVPSWASLAGRAFHSACDQVDMDLFLGISLTNEICKLYWNRELNNRIEDTAKYNPDQETWKASGRRTAAKPNGEDGTWWRWAGVEMVQDYWTYRKAEIKAGFDVWIMPDGRPAIEVPFDFELAPGVQVRGYIDRIMCQNQDTGFSKVRDLKSGAREPSDSAQLGIYRVAINHEFGFAPGWGDYFMARKGVPSESVSLGHFTEGLFAEQYGAVAQMMRLKLYPANPDMHCSWCDVAGACAIKGGREADAWSFVLP